jgi:hypothetical protein
MDMSVQNGVGAKIMSALQTASRTTGIDFGYLAATAKRESAFDPNAEAPTSSATGLFQFIDQTWLQVLRDSGAELGYAEQAQAIETRADGSLQVSDPAKRDDIMALRKDPIAASLMAGALTQSNESQLREAIGREPNDGELYIAHFLGASGASRLINTAEVNPEVNATRMFPAAAKANRSIFYERDGSPRNAAEVHQQLISKHLETQSAALGLSEDVGLSRGATSGSSDMASPVPDPNRAVSRIPTLEDGASAGVFADLFRPAVGEGLSGSQQQRLAMADGVQSLFTTANVQNGPQPPRIAPVLSAQVQPAAAVSSVQPVPIFEASAAPARSEPRVSSTPATERSQANDRAEPAQAAQPDLFQRVLNGIASFFGIRSG